MWTHNTAATIRQGAKAGTDAKILKGKLSVNWTGPFKILAVGPSPTEATPDGRPLAAKFFCTSTSATTSLARTLPVECR